MFEARREYRPDISPARIHEQLFELCEARKMWSKSAALGVPAGARSASVTSLTSFYAQMRPGNDASGRQPTSSVVFSTNTVPGNRRVLDSMAQNSPPRERASFKSEAVLGLPAHSQSSSKEKSKKSTPNTDS